MSVLGHHSRWWFATGRCCSLPAVVLSRQWFATGRWFSLGGGSLPAGVVRSWWWFSLADGSLPASGSLSVVVRYRPGCSLPAVVLSRRLFALGGGSLPAGVVRSRWWFSLGGGSLRAGLFAPGGGSLPAVVRFRRWFALGGGSLSAVVLSRPGCSLSEVVRSRWFSWFTLRPYLRWSPPPNRQRQTRWAEESTSRRWLPAVVLSRPWFSLSRGCLSVVEYFHKIFHRLPERTFLSLLLRVFPSMDPWVQALPGSLGTVFEVRGSTVVRSRRWFSLGGGFSLMFSIWSTEQVSKLCRVQWGPLWNTSTFYIPL